MKRPPYGGLFFCLLETFRSERSGRRTNASLCPHGHKQSSLAPVSNCVEDRVMRPASIMLGALSAILTTAVALPARAQLLYDPIKMDAPVLTGSEPELRLHPAPATAPEQHANLLWNLRAGLNVAALGCQFSPSLATVRNYNQLLRNQREE